MSLPAGAREARRVGGGDVNEAFRVVLEDGREAFVKTRAGAEPGEYAAEAAGLAWLGDAGGLRTPRVIDVADDYLALEWITPGALGGDGERELGAGLAATHLEGTAHFGAPPGAEGTGWLGPLRLSNEPTEDWPSFYAQRRLWPLTRLARDRGVLGSETVDFIARTCERLPELTGEPEPPARLHGDLWRGNVLGDEHGRPWLIDPSAYGGNREVDLAMLSLFGSPSGALLDAYTERAPLAEGWEQRVGLYQLLPLLVHALLFCGSYRDSVTRTAKRYGA